MAFLKEVLACFLFLCVFIKKISVDMVEKPVTEDIDRDFNREEDVRISDNREDHRKEFE